MIVELLVTFYLNGMSKTLVVDNFTKQETCLAYKQDLDKSLLRSESLLSRVKVTHKLECKEK